MVVLASGFTQQFYGRTGGGEIRCGVLLGNMSSDDAFGITVAVSIVAADGTVLDTDTQKLTAIPAGAKFAVDDWLPL